MSAHRTELATLVTGNRLRWAIVCVAVMLLTIGPGLVLSDVSILPLAFAAAVGSIANFSIHWLVREQWYRPWFNVAFCLIDISLVGLAIVYLGPGGTIAGFFLVTVPCAQRGDRSLGAVSLISASVAYLGAALLHGALSSETDFGALAFTSPIFLDLGVFLAVGVPVMQMITKQNARINLVQSVVKDATRGSLDVRASVNRGENLWELACDLNRLLEQVASTTEAVELEMADVTNLAKTAAGASVNALDSGRTARVKTERLAHDMDDFQTSAEVLHTETANLAREAHNIHSREDRDAREATEISHLALQCSERVASATETATEIGIDLHNAAGRIEELGAMSRQIGSAALSNAKIARHTHVLALNAAIEAARAEEHGREFAVVAERVRTLAAEAGRSAREVRELISEVQSGIAAVAEAISAGGEKAAELGVAGAETSTALGDLRLGSSSIAESVATTAGISQNLAERIGIVADRIEQLASTTGRRAADAHDAANTMTKQIAALSEIGVTSHQLSDLAVRLGKATARHSHPEN